MADTCTITTAIKDAGGTGLTGTLYALLTCPLTTADGTRVAPGRQSFTVTTGVAASFVLWVTEDSNPAHASYILTFVDSSGRATDLGPIEVPRSPTANLSDLLAVPGSWDV